MALGLNTEASSGDYAPIVKFDARAGRMFRVDRSQDTAGNWIANNVEVTNGFQAIFDLDNIEIGWALLANGVAPSWSMVKLGEPLPARPSDQHKQCFKIMVKLGKASGGDAREFASQAKVVIGAIDALHTQFLAERPKNAGKLPVVSMTGSTPVVSQGKGQTSTNYAPTFVIAKWVDRPAELGGAGGPTPQPPAPVAPPPPPVMANADEEF